MKIILTLCLLLATLMMTAQNNIAQDELDKGVAAYEAKNFEEAFRWFLSAAQKGNTYAKNNLGLHYLLGQGVEQNFVEARKWLIDAADEGYHRAIPVLWEMDRPVVGMRMLTSYSLHDWEGTDGKYGFVDFEYNEIIIPAMYEDGGIFSLGEELAPVKLNDKWGFINWSNQVIIPFQFEEAHFISFVDGLAAVKQNGKWGFIDTQGSIVVPFLYDSIESGSFINGYAKVTKNGQTLYINKKGKEINL